MHNYKYLFRAWDLFEKKMRHFDPLAIIRPLEAERDSGFIASYDAVYYRGRDFIDVTKDYKTLESMEQEQRYELMQCTGLRLGPCYTEGIKEEDLPLIYEQDYINYKGNIYIVEYEPERAGFLCKEVEPKNQRADGTLALDCDIAYESSLVGNSFETKLN